MKEQEIIEGNKLIAEFMGASFHEDTPMILEKHVVSPSGYAIKCADKLRYNSSWDWLMPVVEKIESFAFEVTIGRPPAGWAWCKIESPQLNWCSRQSDRKKIGATYQAVVKFIKWHNNQPNQ